MSKRFLLLEKSTIIKLITEPKGDYLKEFRLITSCKFVTEKIRQNCEGLINHIIREKEFLLITTTIVRLDI